MFQKLSNNLNLLMAQCRLNASELARYTGLPATSIKKIRNHEHSNPTLATLSPIAKYFSISMSQLIGDSPLPAHYTNGKEEESEHLPLFTLDECKHWPTKKNKKLFQPYLNQLNKNNLFAVTIIGKEWEAFPDNTVLIIDPNETIRHQDFVIVKNNDINEMNLRSIHLDEGTIFLKPLTKGCDLMVKQPIHQILGVVIASQRQFRE